MKNLIGTVYYEPVRHDRFGQLIYDVRKEHKLDVPDPFEMPSNYLKRFDGAKIGVQWRILYSKDRLEDMMEAFLRDVQIKLLAAGAKGVTVKMTYSKLKLYN